MNSTNDSSNVRSTALGLLLEAGSSHQFVDELLARRVSRFQERDRHLLQEVVYGAVRHNNTLDHILDFHLRLPTARQKAPVAWALRLGAYQLIYLDRVPAHAAVNQTLEALKARGAPSGQVGFANAVLHAVAGEVRFKTEEPPVDPDDLSILPVRRGYCHFSRPILPPRILSLDSHLAIKYSHPAWLIRLWLERHGEEETRRICLAGNATAPLTARVTKLAPPMEDLTAALEAEGWGVGPGPTEDSITFSKAGDFDASKAFAGGWFLIQDATAIQVGRALKPPPGSRVLDLCAAPGSKTAQLLEAVGPEGHVVAADRSEERLRMVRETLSRFGSNFTTRVVPGDPDAIDFPETFTHVLVDAPCSNTGVLARRVEARWRLKRGDLQSLAKLQISLIEAGLRHLAPGGRLLYATCSIEPEENEEVAAEVCRRHPELVELETRLFLPHRTPGDGGFYSLLMKPR